MPNRDPGLDAAREAHLAAYFAAGDFAAALDLDSRNPYRLDWLRFRVAQQYFFSQHAHGECRQQFRDNVRHRQMQRAEFAAICDLEPAGPEALVIGMDARGQLYLDGGPVSVQALHDGLRAIAAAQQ